MNILVRLPNWLGDLVMSGAFMRACAGVYGGPLDVIVKREHAPLLRLFENIGDIYPFDGRNRRSIPGWTRFHRAIARAKRYDLFFCLPDSFSSAAGAFVTGSDRRIGYAHEGRSPLLTHAYAKPSSVHRVLEYRGLLEAYLGDARLPEARVCLNASALDGVAPVSADVARPLILFNPNSEAQSRRIPPDKAAAFACRLLDAFQGTLVIPGTKADRGYVKALRDRIRLPKRCIDAAGKTDCLQLAALCRAADLVVSTDSGIAHLAAALGRPTAVIFGAGDPERTAPFAATALAVLRAESIDCSPCVSNTCREAEPPCIMQIRGKALIAACRTLLNG